ncbi:tetratricopeptide repeat protein [Novosphingobium sp. 9]|uniref:tetratricopeptide repeat protein n=1 Tax=Novosphingobium sp. 9 TaxID=2025349 RepID=UPI0021B597D1|nr:tetratricopeptide repeat protein [Novosphingobium sp. 9]
MALIPTTPNDKAAAAKAQGQIFQREVDDAMRQDRMEDFFKRYGVAVAVLVVAILAAIGGFFFWKHEQTKARDANAEVFVQALDSLQAGNFDDVKKKLGPVVDKADGASGASAKLLLADVALKQNRLADAVKMYDAVAADTGVPQPLRDLATVRSVAANYDTLKPQAVVDRLKPLAQPGNPWFGAAGEMIGAAYVAQGKKDLAGPIFAEIAKDETQPDSLRNRARQLASVLGVDAVDPVVDADGKPLPNTPTVSAMPAPAAVSSAAAAQ